MITTKLISDARRCNAVRIRITNNRRKVLEGKGRISHEAAVKKVGTIYEEFRKKQDAEYISEFDRQIAAYLKGDKL